jgi:hypothetical protein
MKSSKGESTKERYRRQGGRKERRKNNENKIKNG